MREALVDGEYDLADLPVSVENFMGVRDLFERQDRMDAGDDLPRLDQRPDMGDQLLSQPALVGWRTRPRSVEPVIVNRRRTSERTFTVAVSPR